MQAVKRNPQKMGEHLSDPRFQKALEVAMGLNVHMNGAGGDGPEKPAVPREPKPAKPAPEPMEVSLILKLPASCILRDVCVGNAFEDRL